METTALFTAGGGVGAILYFILLGIKKIFPIIGKRERWILFALFYLPAVYAAIKITANLDPGGEQKNPQKNMDEKHASLLNENLLQSTAFAFSFTNRNEVADLYDEQNSCGVGTGEYQINQSFNDEKPYYIRPGRTSLRLVLADLNTNNNTTIIKISDNENPLPGVSSAGVLLAANASSDFIFNQCRFRITYYGYGSFTESVQYLFRKRYYAKIKLEKI